MQSSAGREKCAASQRYADSGPVWLKLLTLGLAAYALLPSVAAPPVAIEGFEAAVTSAVNQPIFAASGSPFPPFLYATRPGEYFLYRLSTSIFGGDALLHGQLWSLVAYFAGLIGVMLMAHRGGFARPWAAALAYFSLFDVAANVAQASSSNLAMGFLALGGGLFCLRGSAGKIAGLVVVSFATFCRLDALALAPIALLVSVLAQTPTMRALTRSIAATLGVAALAWLFYAVADVSIGQAFGDRRTTTFAVTLYGIKNIILILFPWSIVPPLFGVTFGQREAWRTGPLIAAMRAFIVLAPPAITALLYLAKMDTPRYFASASPFLALGSAMLIERLIRSARRTRAIALAALITAMAATWAVRSPGMTNDGFRYRWAVYLTPYERFREKRFLAQSAPRMFEDAIENGCEQRQGQDLSIIAMTWRHFAELARRMVLVGARLEGADSHQFGQAPPGARYRFRLGGRAVNLFNLNKAAPTLGASDLAAIVDQLRSRGRVTVVGWQEDKIRGLLERHRGGRAGYSGAYERYQRASTFSAHFNQAGAGETAVLTPTAGFPTGAGS